jgi:hypothetical protein
MRNLPYSLSPCAVNPESSPSLAPVDRVPRRRRIPAGHCSIEPPHRSPLRSPSFPTTPSVQSLSRAAAGRASAPRHRPPLPRQISMVRVGWSLPRPASSLWLLAAPTARTAPPASASRSRRLPRPASSLVRSLLPTVHAVLQAALLCAGHLCLLPATFVCLLVK